MADVFLGEIRVFGCNFAPTGWAMCNGQLLPLAQNTALFSLLGTYYGGDGKSTFGLPNLKGSLPLDYGQGPGLSNYAIGETGGSPAVTLLTSEMPIHNHAAICSPAAGNSTSPGGNAFAGTSRGKPPAYGPSGSGTVNMSPSAVATAGSGQPHENMPPYLTLNFCIALQGIYPSRG